MRTTLVVHIAAGTTALLSGYVALYAAKGARLHRRSGRLFVYAMLTMATCGLLIAAIGDRAPAINIPAALTTIYLVVTALTTVRPPFAGARPLQLGATLVAVGVAVTMLTFGVEAVRSGGRREGIPAFPFFLFAGACTLGTIGDVRLLRAGSVHGATRLARHLWRMSFALLIAAMSFFLGQAKVIPRPIRIPALLAAPIVAVVVAMIYWMWRVRFRRSLRGLVVRVGAADPPPRVTYGTSP